MSHAKTPAWLVAAVAGLLPVLAVNAAFLMNIEAGLEACFPYWEGCMSVSRGVRSGPGLVLFKILALPSAAAVALCWRRTGDWMARGNIAGSGWRKAIVRMGIAGAVFMVVYAMWLGTEGEVYRWLRRYGVVFYFGLTGLAQLFLVSVLWRERRNIEGGRLARRIAGFSGIVTLSWLLGVASALKRKVIENPEFLDRVENALEWDFALSLSLSFVALSWVFYRSRIRV